MRLAASSPARASALSRRAAFDLGHVYFAILASRSKCIVREDGYLGSRAGVARMAKGAAWLAVRRTSEAWGWRSVPPPCWLPASSIRLPANRKKAPCRVTPHRVCKSLIDNDLPALTRSNCGAVSIFLPDLREAESRFARRWGRVRGAQRQRRASGSHDARWSQSDSRPHRRRSRRDDTRRRIGRCGLWSGGQ
jgi:hypothetical protein